MQSTTAHTATVTIRPARLEDAERLWAWRNDPDTRRASRNTETVPLDQHMDWFRRSLARDDRILLIAEFGGEAIGTVRFDRRDDNYLEVSINVAPQARARKLGAACLREGCNFVLKNGPAGLHAAIRPDNVASLRIFKQCGFRDFGREDGFMLLRRHPDAQAGRNRGAGSGDV